ncbi:TetR/AcrR family transcriptional regulator [Paenibacillus donghaensis]|uniref:TetR family transcriptional regulator n=1 Tax=Paenibacillus donghaensis TaxID=414771 RepID=A0A2Z2KNR4_9BACL|nr:TetR/AcrR family transcriptional regulator [Paenibacillus donghaensis]ASA22852.1 TetR family transcriptional regulator [Paenibacillus donghaensis]
MPYPKGHKVKVRNHILDSAAQAFRKNGIRESSVPSIMKGAGLTHGGFYSHFESKEQLIAETCSNIVNHTIDILQTVALEENTESKFDAVINYYLSPYHRDHIEGGCIIPTLSGEISQSSEEIREIFSQELDRFIEFISDIAGCDKSTGGVVLSIMIGSLILARGVQDPVSSDNILAAGRTHAMNVLHSNSAR